MGDVGVGEVRAGTTSPMPDHKGFKLQYLVNFQKFSILKVKIYLSSVTANQIIDYNLDFGDDKLCFKGVPDKLLVASSDGCGDNLPQTLLFRGYNCMRNMKAHR